VHLYAFSKFAGDDARADVLARASCALGCEIRAEVAKCREVRLVAPGKRMVCISFGLPQDILRWECICVGVVDRKAAGAGKTSENKEREANDTPV